MAALILAGGAGTRLWPLSTDREPKQFLRIFGGASLLQLTFERLRRMTEPSRIFVSTNDRYSALVAAQLPELPPANILVEPARKNTAPAIAICSAEIERRLGAATVLAIFPSDHSVGDADAFVEAIGAAARHAAAHDDIVTIALRPTEPNTGFGYLELGDAISEEVLRLERFVEKPDRARAEEFLRTGVHAWNGGMFIFRLDAFHSLLNALTPEIAQLAREFVDETDEEKKRATYAAMPSISIDYAVMEKAPKVAAVPAEFGWSDVGSWAAVAEILRAEQRGVHLLRSDDAFVLTDNRKPVAIVGLPRIAVIESDRGLLVLNLDDSDGLSALVAELESKE